MSENLEAKLFDLETEKRDLIVKHRSQMNFNEWTQEDTIAYEILADRVLEVRRRDLEENLFYMNFKEWSHSDLQRYEILKKQIAEIKAQGIELTCVFCKSTNATVAYHHYRSDIITCTKCQDDMHENAKDYEGIPITGR